MDIEAKELGYAALNDAIRSADGDCRILGCLGQRFIAAGMSDRRIEIHGIPGNALGAYLDGAQITVYGNAQDAVGDTMNDGSIVIHGNIGDAAGYAMRGGTIFVRGNAGYRAGIHVKEYGGKKPTIVVGGRAGSFLGEYQAGGLILVLGLHRDGKPIVGNFPCTGMHGGRLFLRSDCKNILLPGQVVARPAGPEDLRSIEPYLQTFCHLFGGRCADILRHPFTVIEPNSSNPYRQLYVTN